MRQRGVSLATDLWLVAAIVLAGLIYAATIAVPTVGLVAGGLVIGLGALAAGLLWPRLLIGATLLAALFVQTAERLLPVPGISSLDEAAVAMCVVCILIPATLSKRVETFPGLPWFAAYVALGLLSSVIRDVPLAITGQGLLLAIKGLLVGWAAAQLTWDAAALRIAARVGFGVLLLGLVCGLINAAIPGAWTSLLAGASPEYRGPFPSLIGPWKHPSFYGQMMALCAVGALAYRQAFNRNGRLWFVLAAIAAALSFRRKTITGLLTATGLMIGRRSPWLLFAVAVPAVVLIGFGAWDTIRAIVFATADQYLFNTAHSPRNLLLRGSVTMANHYFPLGAGFGRYGSFTAFEHYSPEYVRLGFPFVWGLGPNDVGSNFFASDTFWPSVVGETGWLGAAAYVTGIIAIGRSIRAARGAADPWITWLGLVAGGWFVVLLMESVAAPVFVSPPTAPLLFAAAGMLAAARRGAAPRSEASPQVPALATPRRRA